MNDPQVTQLMTSVRTWLAMATADAKAAIRNFMDSEGIYSALDYKLLEVSETTDEAIGLVFGV
jgi:hypothetical protein